MASNYWTDGRQRLCRLQAAVVRMSEIVRDLVDIRFSAKQDHAYPSLSDNWKLWCYDNHGYIKKYRFWKKQPKSEYLDLEIPTLDEVDVTFSVYLMARVDPDCPAIKMFQEVRNLVSHMTETELDELSFHDRFQMIIEAVNVGFQSHQEAWRKWRTILDSIRTENISNLEHFQLQFQNLVKADRLEVSQKNLNFGNIQDCQNVQNFQNIYNITVTGDAKHFVPTGKFLDKIDN